MGPVQVQVLGRRLVCFQEDESSRGKDARWAVLDDQCSHRLAPLSQGRVDPATGCIQCPYHGWEFDGSGACTRVPQLVSPSADPAKARATLGAVPGVAGYTTRVTGDVLWAFFDASVPAQAAAIGSEVLPFTDFPEERYPRLGAATNTYTRELPYSFDFLVENFMDPAHIPFGE